MATEVSFGELGYAAAARDSYQVFARLKRAKMIPEHCRLQVSLPSPLSPISAFISSTDQAVIEPIYERRLLEELAEISETLPHDQLAVQWDANFEFAMLDGSLSAWFDDVQAGVVERLVRLGSRVPDDVELGFHLCHGHSRPYGPPGRDVRTKVLVANALSASLSRPLNWVHIPVPSHRVDAADYEPLAGLRLRSETELYLGVISPDDGETGARARLAMAERVIQGFGVATACGWGRFSPSNIPALVGLHAALSQPNIAPPVAIPFVWPAGFERIPEDPWVSLPVHESAIAYNRVEGHSWYSNLDPTVAELSTILASGGLLVDYSGGTGILIDRLKLRLFSPRVGAVVVDSSPKFLRVALEKFRNDPAVAFRHLRFLQGQGRLERLDEVLGPAIRERGIDVIASSNAIHLYKDLGETVESWARCLRPGGRVLINSGNIRNPRARHDEWILDETVWVISDLALGIVRSDDGYRAYRPALDDERRMKDHAAFRDRVFLEPRSLDYYLETLEAVGLQVERVREATIDADVNEWYEFLCAYHDAVLGWVGGTRRIDGAPPSAESVRDRLRLIRQALDLLFGRRPYFRACWTYVTCGKA
jgi:SAM-dependent methyltransferase